MSKKALMTYGGWDGHEPRQTSDRFLAFLRGQGYEVVQSASLDSYLDAPLMASLDLIVQTWTCGRLTAEQWKGLNDAVTAGCGFAGWHGGIVDAFRGNVEYQWMTGGQFVSHPGGIIDYPVHLTAWDDPITAGLADFRMRSEQYYLLVDPSNTVLATTVFDGVHDAQRAGTAMPVVWKRRWGRGRVFVNALGHVDADFAVPEARIITERGAAMGDALTGAVTTLGIIGCGNISGAYLTACKRFPFLRVASCADLVPAAAEAKAKEHGCVAVGVEALLADPAISLVVNLTVPGVHAAVDRDILRAGKHVFSEKPFALTRAEGEAVIALARERGLRVGCAPDTVLGAGVQTCRKLIDDGVIGTPLAFQANMICGGHEHWHPAPEFYYQRGGGPLFDMGPYYLHALITLLGPVKRVTGIARTGYATRTITSRAKRGTIVPVEVPTHIVSVLEFHSGAVGQLTTSFDVKHGATAPNLEIFGTAGSLSVPDPNTTGGPVRLKLPQNKDWVELHLTHPYKEGSRGVGVADLAKAIATGRPHRANEAIAMHALDIMVAIHEAADQGRHITLTTFCERPEPMRADLPDWVLE